MTDVPQLHRTLARQLAKLGLSAATPPDAASWAALLERVSVAYTQADDERYTLERSIEISSSEMQQLHGMLARRARTDDLTRLPNRAALFDDLTSALACSSDTPGIAVLFIDLDRFKEVNDQLGHDAGDEVLVQAASRMRASVRQGDIVSRYGGDEFVALLGGSTPARSAVQIAGRIVQAIGEPFVLGGGAPVSIGASIGVATAHAGTDVAGLLREADQAMYQAKLRGRGQVVVFDPEQAQCRLERQLGLVTDFRAAS